MPLYKTYRDELYENFIKETDDLIFNMLKGQEVNLIEMNKPVDKDPLVEYYDNMNKEIVNNEALSLLAEARKYRPECVLEERGSRWIVWRSEGPGVFASCPETCERLGEMTFGGEPRDGNIKLRLALSESRILGADDPCAKWLKELQPSPSTSEEVPKVGEMWIATDGKVEETVTINSHDGPPENHNYVCGGGRNRWYGYRGGVERSGLFTLLRRVPTQPEGKANARHCDKCMNPVSSAVTLCDEHVWSLGKPIVADPYLAHNEQLAREGRESRPGKPIGPSLDERIAAAKAQHKADLDRKLPKRGKWDWPVEDAPELYST